MQASIHIATLVDVNGVSGQSLRLRQVIHHLASARTVSLLSPGTAAPEELAGRVARTVLPEDTAASGLVGRPFSLGGLRRIGRLFRQLRRFLRGASVVYTDTPLVLLGARYGAGQAGRITEVNGIYSEEWLLKGRIRSRQDLRFRLMRQIEGWALRSAHAVIVVSPGLGEYITHEFRVDPGRVHVIPNGIDPAVMTPDTDAGTVRARLGLTDEPVALFVGSFRPWHGILNLIYALPAALERVPSLKLVLVGDGPTRAACETLTDQLNLREAVLFTGHQPQTAVPAFIAAADVCLYYPTYDLHRYGFMGDPIKLREYMVMGKPIVTVRAPNFAEIVDKEGCGMVVEPDHQTFGRAVAEVVLDPPLAQTMGRNGRNAMSHGQDWETIGTRILAIIEKIEH